MQELKNFFNSPKEQADTANEIQHMKTIPGYGNSHKFYEYTPEEVQQYSYRKLMIRKKHFSTPTGPQKNAAFA